MFRKIALCVVALSLAILVPEADSAQKGRLNQIMIDKLRYSQLLLQGIALADFPKIVSNAEELLRLSKTAEWLANRSPRYEGHSIAFQRGVEAVIQKAKAKNIDGVVLAYQDVTMSCVRCHEYLRETRDARAPMVLPDLTAIVKR